MTRQLSPFEIDIRAQHEAVVATQNQQDSLFEAVVIHEGEKGPIADAAKVLASAFHDDPMMRYLQAQEGPSRRSLQPFFSYVVRSAIEHGSSTTVAYDTNERPVAASVLDLPGTREASTLHLVRHALPRTLESFGVGGLRRAMRGSREIHEKLAALKAEADYTNAAYLNYVGVIPQARGTGAVKAVTAPGLVIADTFKFPIVLVSSNPSANHGSFAKAGYEILEDEPTRYDNGRGPENEFMVRTPRAA